MKKLRIVLGALVFAFAFASAVAFNATAVIDHPAIVNPSTGLCETVENVSCGGSSATCEISGTTYREFASGSTTCGAVLQLPE